MLRPLRTKLLRRATAILKDPTTTTPCRFSLPLQQLPKATVAAAAAAANQSLTVHFLQNFCDLTHEAAAAVSQKVQLKATNKPLDVLALLRDYGFSRPQIAALVSRLPRVLSASPVRTLKPKLDFFRAELRLSEAELLGVLSVNPSLLFFSLEKRLVPNLALLRSLIRDEGKLTRVVKNWSPLLSSDISNQLPPRVEALLSCGATDAVISTLLYYHPKLFTDQQRRFEDALDRIKRMAISPFTAVFAHALWVLNTLPQSAWETRLANYRSLGWSEAQVLHAFSKQPYCMSSSADKVRRKMVFFAEKLGWGPDYVSKSPVVLSLSFEKRILPRCLVLGILASKGLLNGRVSANQLKIGNNEFLKKYVMKYLDGLPELAEAMKDNKLTECQGHEMKWLDAIELVKAV